MFQRSLVAVIVMISVVGLEGCRGSGARVPPRAMQDWLPRDARINRNGNFPRLERKPPLRRIADPANLESDVPAIKTAAEVKQQEDLKKQKVKAIKYLATLGCGCYDSDGKITDALLAAMEDCTEDVRFEAIFAVYENAKGCCNKCGGNCCSREITEKLAEIAYEYDDNGCRIEPSARVRQAAIMTLEKCCPNRAPIYYGPIFDETFDGQDLQIEQTEPQPVPEQLPEGIESPLPDTLTPEGAPADGGTSPDASPVHAPFFPSQWQTSVDSERSTGHAKAVAASHQEGKSQSLALSSYTQSVDVATGGRVSGRIQEVDTQAGTIKIGFPQGNAPPAGTRLMVYRRQKLGRIATAGQLEVVTSEPGLAVSRPIAHSTLA
ncbi:MAG: hypothetical protein KF861_24610, partial [Planctomycetaceae bacterium]|nr:hypothetical protein [Planctomycetaceae bacterium]